MDVASFNVSKRYIRELLLPSKYFKGELLDAERVYQVACHVKEIEGLIDFVIKLSRLYTLPISMYSNAKKKII